RPTRDRCDVSRLSPSFRTNGTTVVPSLLATPNMTGEIISLLSSSPEPPAAKPRQDAPSNPRKRPSDAALTDITKEVRQSVKRTRHESPPSRAKAILDSLDLSDLSDPLELLEPAPKSKPK